MQYSPAVGAAAIRGSVCLPSRAAGLRADAAARSRRRGLAQGRVRPARAAGVQGARRVVGGRAGAARGPDDPDARRRQRGQPRPRGRARRRARAGCARRIYLPARSVAGAARGDRGRGRRRGRRRRDLRGRGARAAADGARAGRASSSPTSAPSGPARWVIDGYATLFSELRRRRSTSLLVPVGVGSLGAAAARWGAAVGTPVIARRAGRRGLPDRLAGRGRADGRRHARHGDGRPGLRGGLRGGVADAARRHPRHDHRVATRRRARRCASSPRAASRSATRAPRRSPRCTRCAPTRVRRVARVIALDRVLLIATEGPTDPGRATARVTAVSSRDRHPGPPQHAAAGGGDGGLLVGAAARRRGLLAHVRARHRRRGAARARAGDLPHRVRR